MHVDALATERAESDATATLSVAVLAADADGLPRLLSALTRDRIDVELSATSVLDLLDGCAAGGSPDVVVAAAPSEPAGARALVDRIAGDLPSSRLVLAVQSAKGVRRLLRSGVDGVVVERDLELALAATVEAVGAGQIAVARELRPHVERQALSFRERQILGLVVMGFANGEIARQLCLAESTIKSHLSSSFAKLGVRSRSEAAALILDPEEGLGTGILALSGAEGGSPSGGVA